MAYGINDRSGRIVDQSTLEKSCHHGVKAYQKPANDDLNFRRTSKA